jgi:agmatinase
MPITKTQTFFGLTQEYSSMENSKAVVLPVPYEATTSYVKGTKDGPRAILEASQQVELFDEELWVEPFKIGIQTGDEVHLDPPNGDGQPFQALTDAVKPIIEADRFPVIIGGEQSMTLGSVRACLDKYPNLSVFHIDAHCDLRSEYEGDPHSHASVAFQIYKALPNPHITQVGIRNISWEEVAWMEEEEPNINVYWARNQAKWDYNEIVNTLSDDVFITIDLGAFDAAVMPSTGTPEPGGLNWYQVLDLLKLVCIRKHVVAADITEFTPIAGMHAPDFLAAKLLYKLIGYRFAMDLGVTKKYL